MLQRLNPNVTFHEGPENNYRTAGVYLRERDKFNTGRARFLFGTARDWVPERDEIDPRTGRVLRRGWHGMVVQMYEQGAVKDRKYYRRITRGWRPHPMP